MKITADTNVLVRAITGDDERQSRIAQAQLAHAGMVALAIPRIDPLMGLMTGLKAFVAAVLGGIGNIPGAMLGGMLIGLMETIY